MGVAFPELLDRIRPSTAAWTADGLITGRIFHFRPSLARAHAPREGKCWRTILAHQRWRRPAPLLRLAPARGDHHGDLGDAELPGGEDPGVARNQATILAHQRWRRPAPLLDARRDRRDLRIRVGPGIFGIRDQPIDRPEGDAGQRRCVVALGAAAGLRAAWTARSGSARGAGDYDT